MRIAVLSGKGGTGKTFISVNLATLGGYTYIDCDVEEPNGHLFFKPQDIKTENVYVPVPEFDQNLCNGCRKCVDFCSFNALVYLKDKPMLFPELCHSCNGCKILCPTGAVTNKNHLVGEIKIGTAENLTVVTGIMKTGEVSAVPIIKKALEIGCNIGKSVIIDCPPGSACSVMESLSCADYCILVVEPTAFGFHNFKMVYELCCILQKPMGIVINKADLPYPPLEEFCLQNNIEVLERINYSQCLAELGSKAEIAVKYDENLKNSLNNLLKKVEMGAKI